MNIKKAERLKREIFGDLIMGKNRKYLMVVDPPIKPWLAINRNLGYRDGLISSWLVCRLMATAPNCELVESDGRKVWVRVKEGGGWRKRLLNLFGERMGHAL